MIIQLTTYTHRVYVTFHHSALPLYEINIHSTEQFSSNEWVNYKTEQSINN